MIRNGRKADEFAYTLDQHLTLGELRAGKRPFDPPRFSDRINRLLRYFDTGCGEPPEGFSHVLYRRQARALRKHLFGSKGLNTVPRLWGGEPMEFDLPKGWRLRLSYLAYGREEDDLALAEVDFLVTAELEDELQANRDRCRHGKGTADEFKRVGLVLAEFLPPQRKREGLQTADWLT